GIILTGYSGAARRDSGRLLVDLFEISGKARYTIDLARQSVEFGCVTPFSHAGGRWTIEDSRLHLMSSEPCASYTGGHSVGDQRVSALVRPLAGTSHLLAVRAGGAMRGYFAGFDGTGQVAIIRNNFGISRLASAAFPWKAGQDHTLEFQAIAGHLSLSIDGVAVLEADDGTHKTGMVGCATVGPARALYGPFEVEEL
ncbi:MAG: ADP-ribosylglycohydrolase family protein, partial [Spirochaetota bacterium]